MARPFATQGRTRSSQYTRNPQSNPQSNLPSNLQSTSNNFAKSTGRATEKAVVGVFKWATTDHLGMGKAMMNMPSMGFFASIKYVLMQLLIRLYVIALMGVLIFVAIGYGIPFLLS